VDDPFRPQLRLFLSFDLEGSTKLKQHDQSQETWMRHILSFLNSFRDGFLDKFEEHRKKKDLEVSAPRLWKVLGDEMIFSSELGSAREAAMLVEAQVAAIEEWNRPPTGPKNRGVESTTAKATRSDFQNLRVKGAAWLAGFPVHNLPIVISESGIFDSPDPENAGQEWAVDYLGPSMDLGFRVSRFATPTWLAITVDLLWFLEEGAADLRVRFEGRREVKGVLDGQGYPCFVVQCRPSPMETAEIELSATTNPEPKRPVAFKDFCTNFMAETGAPAFKPFIYKDGAPPDYDEKVRQVSALRKTAGFRSMQPTSIIQAHPTELAAEAAATKTVELITKYLTEEPEDGFSG
jgi:hypothetical protein